MQHSTSDFWQGDFGDAYTDRCRVDWAKRVNFWRGVIPKNAASALEVGCNSGANLKAIRAACPGLDPVGVDVNEKALLEATGAGFEVHRMAAHDVAQRLGHECFDLVFTAGVLIHIAPEELDRTMVAIIDASRRYVICVEYAFPTEKEVEYRGHAGKLWKRPYAKLYEDMGLEVLRYGFVTQAEGFDNCAWAVLEKPQ